MLGLPKSTDIAKQLPKKAIFTKFELKSAQRDRFDADISRIDIVNVLSPTTLPGLQDGDRVKEIYLLQVTLKQEDYDEKNIMLLTKLINQRMIFALVCQDRVRLAIVHEKLFSTDWKPLATAILPIAWMNMDSVWENMVTTIGHFKVQEGATLEEQIAIDSEKQKLIEQIDLLEKKVRLEKQPRRKLELFEQLQGLKQQV